MVNGNVRNGCEFDSTCHTWILLMKVCRCITKILAIFKNQVSSCCAIVLSCCSTVVARIHEIYCSVEDLLGRLDIVRNRSWKCREIYT